jgi:uncharacterized protein (TIGR02145 family)
MNNMKKINLFQLIAVICCAWFTLGSVTAQNTDTLYVIENGTVIYARALNKIDSLVFYRPNFDDKKSETPEYVEINGVRWATRNVDQPGTFATSPESPGMFYQWNRSKEWSATGSVTSWDSSYPTGDSWEKANDPSPAGYRVPTLDEIEKLFDKTKVANEWTTVNNVNGRKFTDKNNGNSIFLPAVGHRIGTNGTLRYDGTDGYYWGSTTFEGVENFAYSLSFSSDGADWVGGSRDIGFSVRPVADETPATITIQLDKDGSFESGEYVMGKIISAEEDLTKVVVLKDGVVVKTITSFKEMPILKGNDGEYIVVIPGLADGSYTLRAESKTGENSASFTIAVSIDWSKGRNTISENGTYYYKQGATTGMLVVSELTEESVKVALDGKAAVTLSDAEKSYLLKDGTASYQAGANASNFLLAKKAGNATIIDKDGLKTAIEGAVGVLFVKK